MSARVTPHARLRPTDARRSVNDTTFDATLARHASLIGRVAASYEAEPTAREDLLQEIALALWKALPKWRGEGSERSFVASVAHHRCVDHVVSERHHHHAPDQRDKVIDPHAGPPHHTLRHQRHEQLLAALQRLPLGQRQAVTLALEGFSHQEIADALGISVNNADVRVSRARRRLVQCLEACR